MSKLTKYKFSDLYEMSSGISSSKEQAGHGSPFISFSTVFNNYFLPEELPDLMDTSLKEQEIFSVKKIECTLYSVSNCTSISVFVHKYVKAVNYTKIFCSRNICYVCIAIIISVLNETHITFFWFIYKFTFRWLTIAFPTYQFEQWNNIPVLWNITF